jgi:putative transposase
VSRVAASLREAGETPSQVAPRLAERGGHSRRLPVTTTQLSLPFRYFDRDAEFYVLEREKLPHWAQAGTLSFITWRTEDSMPRQVIEKWIRQRKTWLSQQGIDPKSPDWKDRLRQLPEAKQEHFHQQLSGHWENSLDECHGACVLRRPDLARIVADSLHHFDGERYVLSDYVVMPNHGHLIACFPDPAQMLKQCESWKHFTAVQLNRALGRKGSFWQSDSFDHLIRSPEQFVFLRKYIAENPSQANLRIGEYAHYSRPLA